LKESLLYSSDGKGAQWRRYKSAFILLRIPFSIYLMPVYWFAISVLDTVRLLPALGVFLILHLLVYPASNGYNSYQDRDEGSIGGLKQPPKVTKELLHLVIVFDVLAIVLSLFLSSLFAFMVVVYLFVSKAYSYKGIRLKKYPLISTATVTVFQGAYTFVMVQVGIGVTLSELVQSPNYLFALVSTLFLCGSYPLTQIYQHQEDDSRGDRTLSLLLGIKGTFIFAAISLLLGTGLLLLLYFMNNQLQNILVFLTCTFPVVFYFISWVLKARKSAEAVNYENTMRMNKISSICISIAFMIMTFLN
jgi:4-hydroxybenzoate polyprenyltransferase